MSEETITTRAQKVIAASFSAGIEGTTAAEAAKMILEALDGAGLIVVDFDEQDKLIEERDDLRSAAESGICEFPGFGATVERVEIAPNAIAERDAAGNIVSVEVIR